MSSVTELLFPMSETTVILLGEVLLGIKGIYGDHDFPSS